MKTNIRMVPGMGRGVFSTSFIFKDEVIARCEILILNEIDTTVVNETELQFYTFNYDDDRDCLVLGDGEIFNHSETPNVRYRLVEYDGRKVMEFSAIEQMEGNEQLFIDYRADGDVEVEKYLESPSMLADNVCQRPVDVVISCKR